MKIVVDGIMTEYFRAGKTGAPRILLLPGWMSPAKNFAKLMQILSANFDVISVDFPGWPNAENPPRAWNVEDFSNWTKDFLDKIFAKNDEKNNEKNDKKFNENSREKSIEISEKNSPNFYAILGHSFGGRIILKGISEGKFSAKKLIFIDAAGVKPRLSARAKIIKNFGKIAKILPRNLRKKIGEKFASSDYKNLAKNPILRETFSRVVDEDLTNLMPKIREKTLLIWGENDAETPLSDARIFAEKIENSRLEIIKNAGHFSFLDFPEKVEKLVEDFLK